MNGKRWAAGERVKGSEVWHGWGRASHWYKCRKGGRSSSEVKYIGRRR